MTDRQLADRMADALEQLLFDLCGEQEAEDELEKAIGKHAVGSAQRCKKALADFRAMRERESATIEEMGMSYPEAKFEEHSRNPCPQCEGRGWIPLNEGSAVCEKCEGRGCE